MRVSGQETRTQGGFSLIELMIAVAIIGILAAIALPLYNGYVQTSREGVLIYNIATIELFQQERRLREGAFLTEAEDLAEIQAEIGWRPEDDGGITYRIDPGPDGSYEVTATDNSGVSVCLRLPGKVRC